MTLRELKRLTAIWQERLKLLDWDIKARWAKPNEEDMEDRYGLSIIHAETRRAEIILMNPDDYSEEDKQDKTKDIEVFLVHELIHPAFSPFDTEDGTALAIVEENLVSLFSRLLIAIDRRDDEITGRKLSRKASFKPSKKKEDIAVAEETSKTV